ncbi:hypothetical protein Trydic_g11898 [Trypoxylus dichotomus]
MGPLDRRNYPDELRWVTSLLSLQKQKCEPKVEVCCRLGRGSSTSTSEITAGKSSVFSEKNAGLLHTLPNTDEIRPDIFPAGESGSAAFNIISTTAKPIRDVTFNPIFSSTIDYSNAVFGDVRFASTLKGPDYLPPYETTTRPSTKGPDYIPPLIECASGQVLINGRCENRPRCGPGQQLVNGICACIGNTYLANGRCIERTATCGPNERLVNGVCVPVSTPPPIPTCTGGQQYINGRCQCEVNSISMEDVNVQVTPCMKTDDVLHPQQGHQFQHVPEVNSTLMEDADV